MISLVGLPGSGKSTVGRQLAHRLGVPFIDSDQEIEKRLGCSIKEYFERQGETSFRDVEQSALDVIIASLSARPPVLPYPLAISTDPPNIVTNLDVVLSTGGGAVLRQANRDCLRSAGYVVYLRSNPDDIFKRLRYDRSRPLLQVDNPLQKLRDLYETRDPLYRETAHFVIDTGRPSVAMLVNMIVTQLELAGSLPLDRAK